MTQAMPTLGEWMKPSVETTIAAMVAPTSGIRSKQPDEDGECQREGQVDDPAGRCRTPCAAMKATASAPLTKPPMRRRISSVSSLTRSRREAGTSW